MDKENNASETTNNVDVYPKKRVNASYNDPHLKDYQTIKIAETVEGVLSYKAWGASVNLWLFFDLLDGRKIKVSCFQSNNDHTYRARDGLIDFSEIGLIGRKYKIDLGINKKRNPTFIGATEIIPDNQ